MPSEEKSSGPPSALRVVPGVEGGHDGMEKNLKASPRPPPRRVTEPSADELIDGIRARNRTLLARAITLVESNAPKHQEIARQVLGALAPEAGNSVRLGITGVPGAGKSTLIEALGFWLCEQGRDVAVLAVDPSSTLHRGSILGDKTRMEQLARHPRAFIRPSPSGGTLGGVARKTRETVALCEAFGFETVILETVGVGQSEGLVRTMVDFFLLVLIAGAGDELQGIKKGVMELADHIVVNKADGGNERAALLAKAELNRVLSFLSGPTPGWSTRAATISARTHAGLPELWSRIEDFLETTRSSGAFETRRQRQAVEWFESLLNEGLRARFFADRDVSRQLPLLRERIHSGQIPPTQAAENLLRTWESSNHAGNAMTPEG
jgi:LAO/AO transport system kinase